MSNSELIPSLNGVRTLAVLLVAASHVGWGAIVPGGLGVTVFFFLSGYLITTILHREFLQTGRIGLASFYARRFIRLTPPLVITLALAMLLTAVGWNSGGVSFAGTAAQLLYFANYYQIFWDAASNIPAGTGVFWSLAVEEHFYFVYPLLLLGLMKISNRKMTALCLLGICLLVLLWRFQLADAPDTGGDRILYATDTRIDSLLWGCILGLYPALPGKLSSAQSHGLLLVGALLLIASLLIRDEHFRTTARYTVQGLALIPIFCYLLHSRQGFLFRFLNSRFMDTGGKYSYSFYLIHYVVINICWNHALFGKNPGIVFLVAVVSSFAYAGILYAFVERPLKAWRQKRLGRLTLAVVPLT